MTRTQKLNLFTWALNDPVDLDQMNENFDRLDQSGRAAEAALWNSGILLMDGARNGENTAAAENLHFGLLTAPESNGAYSRVKFSSTGASVPTAGQSNMTPSVSFVSIGHSTPTFLTELHPTGYGSLTSITVSGTHSISNGTTRLHLLILRGAETAAEADKLMTQQSGSYTCTVPISCELDPNSAYTVKAYAENMQPSGIQISGFVAEVTPIVPSSGSVTSAAIPVPDWAKRAKLLFRGGNHSLSAEYNLSGESWEALTLTQAPSAGGRNYVSAVSLPAGTQTMRLRVTIPGGGKLGDYMVVFY